MGTKVQHHPSYHRLREFIRQLREGAGLTQRQLGVALRKPQSWIHNCEIGNRRVDLPEFVEWCRACRVDPVAALSRFLGRKRRAT